MTKVAKTTNKRACCQTRTEAVERDKAEMMAEIAALTKGLQEARDAIKEYFRYWEGGPGSFDGKSERYNLRKAGHAASTTLANLKSLT